MPRKSKPSDVPTLADIASKLEVSTRRVSQLKELGMPVHSIEAALAWRMEQEMKNASSGSADELRRAKIRHTLAMAEKSELELSIRRGEFILRSEKEQDDAKIALAVASMLKALVQNLPPLVYGLSSQSCIAKIIREETFRIQGLVAQGHKDFWQDHPLSK